MRKYRPRLVTKAVLALAVLVMAACASTELTNAWRNPDYKGPELRRLFVVGVSKQPALRRDFEDEFVKRLQALGVDAIASYTLIPEAGPATEARLTQTIKQANADGMLVVRLVHTDVDTQFAPAFHPTAGAGLAEGYSAAWAGYHEPTGSAKPETVILETKLYGTSESQLLWSGTTQTFATTSDLRTTIQDFAKLIVETLEKQKLI